jgi:predicted RNase H-like HicB family nuclease
MSSKSLEHYLALDYPYELERDREVDMFVASHPDLPGCLAQGESAGDAIENLDEARQAWIEYRFDQGLPIPEPLGQEEYSGKFLLRMPLALHSKLASSAQRQRVSLNQYINHALSEYEGGARVAREVTDLLDRLTSRDSAGPMPRAAKRG